MSRYKPQPPRRHHIPHPPQKQRSIARKLGHLFWLAGKGMGLGTGITLGTLFMIAAAKEQIRDYKYFTTPADYIEQMGWNQRILELMPDTKGRRVRILKPSISFESADKHVARQVSRDFASIKNDTCEIFTFSTRSRDGVKNFIDANFPKDIENMDIINVDDMALYVFLHETKHCAQGSAFDTASGWAGRAFNPFREADADAYAIRTIERLRPGSNIRQVVMAFRAGEGVSGYLNTGILKAMLENEPLPDPDKIVADHSEWSRLRLTVAANMDQGGSTIPMTQQLMAADFAIALAPANAPIPKGVRALAKIQNDAAKFLSPLAADKMERRALAFLKYAKFTAPAPSGL